MAKNSAVNLDITNNADGFDITGGITPRKLTLTGTDITMTGTGSNTFTYPAASDTLVGRASTDTLTNKTINTASNTITVVATDVSDFDTEVSNNSSVSANTAKATNVSTNLSAGTRTATTIKVDSSDGTDATLVEADTTNAGILGSDKWDEIVANTLKVTNVSTDLSEGTSTTTTVDVNSSDGTNATLVAASTSRAGLLTKAKFDEIVVNNAKTGVTTEISNVVEDTTPQLGGDLDLNQKSIELDPTPTSDHTWNGHIITATAAENLVIGDVCYLNSAGKFAKIDADAESTSKGFCVMATGTIALDATGIFLIEGFIRDDTWAWTVGVELWAPLTPGNPSATKPSATGDIIRLMGYAYSADIIYFSPDKTYVEVT